MVMDNVKNLFRRTSRYVSHISHSKDFKHDELCSEGNEIRLLRIYSRKGNHIAAKSHHQDIQCEIFHVDLEKAPPYKALSYTWGDISNKHYPVFLNGRKFQIRKNLWGALKQLQGDVDDVVVWVDAICIDQKNVSERGHQVRKMKNIYRFADEVVVWLGPSGEDSPLAFALLRELHKLRDSMEGFQECCMRPNVPLRLLALAKLFQRPYWVRMWIVQELTFAKAIVIMCGQDSIKGQDLNNIQSLILGNGDDSADSNLLEKILPDDYLNRAILEGGGMTEVQSWRDLFQERDLSLFECVQQHSHRQATDPRDMIYGLAGVANKQDDYTVEVDYSQSVAMVYTDFARKEIVTSKRLDILMRVQYGASKHGLPSWVPDWSIDHNASMHLLLQEREPEYKFNACGSTEADAFFMYQGRVLLAKGITIGSIETLGTASEMNHWKDLKNAVSALQSWWDMIGELMLDPACQEAFARTIICNRVLERDDGTYATTRLGGILGALADISLDLFPKREVPPILMEYRQRFLTTDHLTHSFRTYIDISALYISDRQLFYDSKNSTMGLAPANSEVGDIICILRGCPHPLVVRQMSSRLYGQPDHYVIIGEAYVDKYMYGAAEIMLQMEEQAGGGNQEFEFH